MLNANADQHDNVPSFVSQTVAEVRQETARSGLIPAIATLVAWLFLFGMRMPSQAADTLPALTALALAGLVGWSLIQRHFWLSQAATLLGLAGAILLMAGISGHQHMLALLAVLPLLAAITGLGSLVLLSELCVAALLLARFPLVTLRDVPATLREITLLMAALTGLVGWLTTHRMLSTAEQWAADYLRAREDLGEQQEQRLRAHQAQEDLVRANRELARLYDRVKAMTQVAEDARRLKEEFVANVSHELRTPLNMIIGFSEVILKSPKVYGARLPDALLADIRAIQRNSQHLTGLVNDVLTMSQVESGKLVLAREWVDVGELLRECQEAVRVLFDSKGLYLQASVSGDPITLFCDRLRMREVLLNLLSNAGRFTKVGGVAMHAWQAEGRAFISVTDSGPGIPPADQQRIFEPFQQLDLGPGVKREGSGLGLSISRRFVELHDGSMWLESQPGKGTTFYIALPLEPLPEIASTARVRLPLNPYSTYEPRDRAPIGAPLTVPERYVLLDESGQLDRLLREFAPQAEVVQATNVDDLVKMAHRSPATALAINTSQTQLTLSQVRDAGGIPQDTPLMTCWIPGERQAAQELGVLRYLVKPISQEGLLAAVREAKAGLRLVLVVDDNPEAVQLFSRMLTSAEEPLRVLRATNGEQALTLMRERSPDVVLLDLVMPNMDGFEVLRIKEQDPAIRPIPVVVASSLDPAHGVVSAKLLTVSRGMGLSGRELVGCIEALSGLLSLGGPKTEPESPESPPD